MGFQQLVEALRYFISCKVIGELASLYSDLMPPAWCKQDTLLTAAHPKPPKNVLFGSGGDPKKVLFAVQLIHLDFLLCNSSIKMFSVGVFSFGRFIWRLVWLVPNIREQDEIVMDGDGGKLSRLLLPGARKLCQNTFIFPSVHLINTGRYKQTRHNTQSRG